MMVLPTVEWGNLLGDGSSDPAANLELCNVLIVEDNFGRGVDALGACHSSWVDTSIGSCNMWVGKNSGGKYQDCCDDAGGIHLDASRLICELGRGEINKNFRSEG